MILAILLRAFDKQQATNKNRRVVQCNIAKSQSPKKTYNIYIYTYINIHIYMYIYIAKKLFTPKKTKRSPSSMKAIPTKLGLFDDPPRPRLVHCVVACLVRGGKATACFFWGVFCVIIYIYEYVIMLHDFICLFFTVHTYTGVIQSFF